MKRGSVIKSSPLSCVLPLGTFAGLSNVEQRPRRLLQTPTPPFMFHTPESLASIGAVPPEITLTDQAGAFSTGGGFPACFVFRPDVYFGRTNCLPRAIRVAVVWDNQSLVPASAAIYLAAYEAEGLADNGVHLYVYSSVRDQFIFNPLAALAPLESVTLVPQAYGSDPPAEVYDRRFAAHDLAGVPGGEVYAAFVSNDPYGFGLRTSVGGNLDDGYVKEVRQSKPTADPEPLEAIAISGYTLYASAEFADGAFTVRRDFYVAVSKAADDRVVFEQVEARCENIRYTFWTTGLTEDVSGPIPGDPAGVPAALGVSDLCGRNILATAGGTRDVPTSIADIVADIADFFA